MTASGFAQLYQYKTDLRLKGEIETL